MYIQNTFGIALNALKGLLLYIYILYHVNHLYITCIFFLCLFLAGNNSAEGFLEVIFLFKIMHIFCWTIDDKPLSDLFSINGVVRFFTNSHLKSNEFAFHGSSFLFKAKIVDAFIRLLSRIYENAAIVHLLLFTLQM